MEGGAQSPPAPTTLGELAALAGMDERLFADFEPGDFEDLTKDLGLSVPVRVQMRKLFKALRERAVVVTAQAKFQQFLQRVHGADALAGLESVPVSPLPEAVAFIRDRPGTPSWEALATGVKQAYAKADAEDKLHNRPLAPVPRSARVSVRG